MDTARRTLTVWAALASVLAAGCEDCNTTPPPKTDASRMQVDCEIDQQYNADSALDLAPGAVAEGTICPEGFDDRDYYRVTTGPNDGILEIHLYNDTGFTGVDLRAALLLADGTPTTMAVSNSNGTGAVTDLRASFGVDPSTTYIIEIGDEGADDGDPANKYFLEVQLSAEPDSNEDNDSVATATAAACAGQAIAGYLATRADQDYFQCNASGAPARLKLHFAAGTELGWQPHLLVTNDEGQPLLDTQLVAEDDGSYDYTGSIAVIRHEANVQNPERSQTFAHTGAVTVMIEDVDGTHFNYDATSGRYDLTLTVDSGPGNDTEPATRNDAPGAATVVSSGQTVQGYLATIGDVDWYRVPGAAGANVLELELSMPADGVVPAGVDPARVGVNFTVYDAYLSVTSTGTAVTTGCTESPTYATQLSRCSNFNRGADDCNNAHGEQEPVCLPGGFCGEMRYSRLGLQGASAQGVPQAATFRTAIAVRKNQPIFVAVSQFQSQVFHDQQPYSLRFTMVADPDGQEPNDLPPALNREARYSSSAGEVRSCNASHFAVPTIGSYGGIPACPAPEWTCPTLDGGTTDVCDYSVSGGACMPWNNNTSVDGGLINNNPYTSLDCSGAGTGSYTATGYLSYLGDRDYFAFNLPPGDIEVNIDLAGSGAASTGLEAGVFVFTSDRWRLYASFVDAQRANTVSARSCGDWRDCCDNIFTCDPDEVPCNNGLCAPPESCASHSECPEDYLCIRERCFRDDDSHAVPNRTFGPEGGNCLVAPTCGEANPWIIEITDNGQNDYDLDMQYTLTVRWRCNCPEECGYCRAPLYYRNCTDSVR